jgi:hypothetical protein
MKSKKVEERQSLSYYMSPPLLGKERGSKREVRLINNLCT